MILIGENRNTGNKTYPSATLLVFYLIIYDNTRYETHKAYPSATLYTTNPT